MNAANGKGTLPLIAGLLLSSVAIRVAIGAGEAVAKSEPEFPEPQAVQSCPVSPAPSALLAALQQRSEQLDQEELQLTQRRSALEQMQTEIALQLETLEAAENGLKDTIAVAETAAEADVLQLIAVYEAMKPKEAAPLFSVMEPKFAAGFLSRMAPEAAAGILAGMDPQTALSISVLLASRNALAPKD